MITTNLSSARVAQNVFDYVTTSLHETDFVKIELDTYELQDKMFTRNTISTVLVGEHLTIHVVAILDSNMIHVDANIQDNILGNSSEYSAEYVNAVLHKIVGNILSDYNTVFA